MKRYTYMDGKKWRLRIGDTEYSGPEVDRLAAYENTGLDPEEIEESKFIIASKKDPKKLRRIAELVQADREGRCVILPCKPSGVTVYQLRNKKHALGPGVHPRHIYCTTVWADGKYQLEHQGYEPCRDRDFGKKWFLDEEAAEAALKGELNG